MQLINQSIKQSSNRSINQLINQSINQAIKQSINQSIKRSINQSINDNSIKRQIPLKIERVTAKKSGKNSLTIKRARNFSSRTGFACVLAAALTESPSLSSTSDLSSLSALAPPFFPWSIEFN
jgi:hypothetical protein